MEKNFANNSRACEQRITNNRKLYLRKKNFFPARNKFYEIMMTGGFVVKSIFMVETDVHVVKNIVTVETDVRM